MEQHFVIFGDYNLFTIKPNPDGDPEAGYADGAVIVSECDGKEEARLYFDEKSLRPLAEALMMATLMAEAKKDAPRDE
jgi:hypothetical protein